MVFQIGVIGHLIAREWTGPKSLPSEEALKAAKPTTEMAAGFAAEPYLIFRSEIWQADQEALLFFIPQNVGDGQIILEWCYIDRSYEILIVNISSGDMFFCLSIKIANWLKPDRDIRKNTVR